MHIEKEIIEVFPFINQTLKLSYNIDSYFHTPPYDNLWKSDKGFRRMMWNHFPGSGGDVNFLKGCNGYYLYVIKSNLGFYNIVAQVTKQKRPDLIAIGPFLDSSPTPSFYKKIMKEHNFSSDFSVLTKQFYQQLAIANTSDVIFMTCHLISTFIPEFQDTTIEYIDYSKTNHELIQTYQYTETFSFNEANRYVESLHGFLNSLVLGNSAASSEKLKLYLDATGIIDTLPVHVLNNHLLELNVICMEKLLNTSVHPYYTLSVANDLRTSIHTSLNKQKLINLAYSINRKYSLLVRNYSLQRYSYLIHNVINYISTHFSEDLTLSVLAKQFNKNASFLSGQFSIETGKSITSWIRETRINEAIHYFNTTDFPISEVASLVGIHDFSYFSRIFKKQTNLSPREYRNLVK
ncbi:MAG: helix-turn-helix domain-containing protein [Suipraeoptans sp.]